MKASGNLFLVGLMGAGKTTIGRQLARLTGKTFYDSDHEIEARTGVRIPVIFEIEGEAGFRVRESEMIAELATLPNIVLATGGGAVLNPNNRQVLANHGTVIYLRAGIDDILARTQHDKNRPLLQIANPRAKLEALFAQRDPLYREVADVVIDTSRQNINTLVHRLLRQIELRHHDHT
jgi:shikimate kinase